MNSSDNSTQTPSTKDLYHLPFDIHCAIVHFCDWPGRTNLRNTCKTAAQWTEYIQNNRTWRNTLLMDSEWVIECDFCPISFGNKPLRRLSFSCIECNSKYARCCMTYTQCQNCGFLYCEWCKDHEQECYEIEVVAVYRV